MTAYSAINYKLKRAEKPRAILQFHSSSKLVRRLQGEGHLSIKEVEGQD